MGLCCARACTPFAKLGGAARYACDARASIAGYCACRCACGFANRACTLTCCVRIGSLDGCNHLCRSCQNGSLFAEAQSACYPDQCTYHSLLIQKNKTPKSQLSVSAFLNLSFKNLNIFSCLIECLHSIFFHDGLN